MPDAAGGGQRTSSGGVLRHTPRHRMLANGCGTGGWPQPGFGDPPVPRQLPPRLRPELDLPLRTRRFIGGCRRSVAFLHHVTRRPQLEPALERVIELWRLWRHDINRIHREALDDIASLVDKMHEHTMAARSAAVRATCTTPGKFRRRSL